jgi:hypothetical protein
MSMIYCEVCQEHIDTDFYEYACEVNDYKEREHYTL